MWLTVKKDFYLAMRHFFNHARLPNKWQETAIVLMPKTPNQQHAEDYQAY